MKSSHMLVLAGLWCSPLGATPSEIELDIQGITSSKGHVIVTVYGDSESWLKRDKALTHQKLKAEGQELRVRLPLPQGRYALHIFQDENDNEKLDMKWLPPGPGEPWVVSNKAQGRMGPPSFNDASFSLEAPTKLALSLQKP